MKKINLKFSLNYSDASVCYRHGLICRRDIEMAHYFTPLRKENFKTLAGLQKIQDSIRQIISRLHLLCLLNIRGLKQ